MEQRDALVRDKVQRSSNSSRIRRRRRRRGIQMLCGIFLKNYGFVSEADATRITA